jgi:hypothetical protein
MLLLLRTNAEGSTFTGIFVKRGMGSPDIWRWCMVAAAFALWLALTVLAAWINLN